MSDIYKEWDECLKQGIGEKLRFLRYNCFDKPLSLQQVCDRLNNKIKIMTISRIESGKYGNYDSLLRLMEFYNVSFDWLVNGRKDDLFTGEIKPFGSETHSEKKKKIVEKIKAIVKSDDYFIIDDNFLCAVSYHKSHFSGYIESGDDEKPYRLITLVRFCHHYDIDFGWLINGDIADMEAGVVPKWKTPTAAECGRC